MAKQRTALTAADRIADAIVKLVERRNGPVALTRIEDEVPGFAAPSGQGISWSYEVGDSVLWNGMTKAGCAALRQVLTQRRVAIEYRAILCLVLVIVGRIPPDGWIPVALWPARMATLETPRFLIRGSADMLEEILVKASAEGKTGFRLLKQAT